MIGESKGISIPKNSNDLYGINLKIKLSDKLFETSTVNAPFDPDDGLMVPEIYDSESMCLKITLVPNVITVFFLLSMAKLNWASYDFARALRMVMLGVYYLPSFSISALCNSSLISKLPAGIIWKIAFL